MKKARICFYIVRNALVFTLAALTVTAASHGETYSTDIRPTIGTAWPLANGVIVTCNHVVSEHDDVVLMTRSGEEIQAIVVLRDAEDDIAFLVARNPGKLPMGLPVSESPVSLGAKVFTIGYPRADVMGVSPKLTDGIISSVNGAHDDPHTYQVSVPIQPGNSGGPLINMNGEVVGVVSAMLTIDGRYALANVNYAVKVSVVRDLLGVLPDDYEHPVGEISHATTLLEDLATRIQDSALMVQVR